MTDKSPEPLLQEAQRYTLFPIRHHDIWEKYNQMKAMFWSAEEIDLQRDLDHWVKLSENEQFFIKNVLAFFAGSDGLVMENIIQRFTNDVPILEAQFFYTFQAMMENVHSHTYSLLIDTYIKDPNEKHRLFNAIETIPVIKDKAQFALDYISSNESFSVRLLAFLIFEGIFFSGSFCAIYWLKERGLMPGLSQSNDLIARDENIHAEFAVLLYSKLQNKLPIEQVHDMFEKAVLIETAFICESIPCKLVGMNQESMTLYIQYVANYWLKKLKLPILYPITKNPFPFMERISMSRISKPNFFECKVSSYNIASVMDNKPDFNSVHEDF